MAREEQKQLSAEIMNKSRPNDHGSIHFSVKVRPTLPDFITSVSLKYVKLGYGYLICRRFYLFIAPIFLVILSAEIGKLICQDLLSFNCDLTDALFLVGLLVVLLYVYFQYLAPHPTYLLDFACYRPPDDLKVWIL